jgi:hypothetical protein
MTRLILALPLALATLAPADAARGADAAPTPPTAPWPRS